jgi:DNA-binding response OmpR family regulator
VTRGIDAGAGPGDHLGAVPPTRGTVVLAEADPATAMQFMHAAAKFGLRTIWCRDGAEALLAVAAEAPDVLVISADTADADGGAKMVATVRGQSDLPILVGATDGGEGFARLALTAGASAVISRPYDISAIAPFAARAGSEIDGGSGIFSAGPIEVDERAHITRVRGRHVQLTQRELDLLVFLIKQRGKIVSREEISRAVWGGAPQTNTVAVHVKRLREKLGSDSQRGAYIRTIRGAGYGLAPMVWD